MFADDTNLVASHNIINDLILQRNNELIKVNTWFQINELLIHIYKTNFIIFHPTCKLLPNLTNKVRINNMDQNLNWENHTEILGNKLSKSLNIIRLVMKYIDRRALLNLYITLIHPYLEYCNFTVYGVLIINV